MEVGGALVEAAAVVAGEFSCACKALAVAKKIEIHRTAISVLVHSPGRYLRLIDERSMKIFLDKFPFGLRPKNGSFYLRKRPVLPAKNPLPRCSDSFALFAHLF